MNLTLSHALFPYITAKVSIYQLEQNIYLYGSKLIKGIATLSPNHFT